MKKYIVLVAAMMMIAGMVSAQEVEGFESAEIADTLIANVDTVELDPDPEWYVAPLNYDSVMARRNAPRRAAANNCPIDSVRTFNVDSVLESVTVYEYGDTTRTMVWTVNPDGSRYGSSRTEEGTNGNITFSASYTWDADAGDWKGTSKEEHMFTGSKETLCTLYDWQNGAWSAETQYTWVFDAAGRETEYTTYQRNNAGALVYSKQRLREYNAAGKMTQEINYTAHNGTDWSAGTKRIYDYDGSNTILNEYYGSLSNGAWVGSSKEVWAYTAGKKTYYEKDTWSNGAWVGSSKEIWAYNGPSAKQTLHEKYGWVNGDWAITLQENSGYDTAGNTTLIENYNYNLNTGVVISAKKEEYAFNAANKKTLTLRYKWVAASSTWDYSTKLVNDYDAAGNTIETANYSWKNEAWVGTGNRTLKTYNDSNKVTEDISQKWSADATDWVNVTRKTTEYEGAKTTQEASYKWQNDAWTGTSRSDWHYNAAGKNDTIKTYTYEGTEWIYSDRTAKTYNAAGTEIMVHNAHWDAENSKWVMTSMTRTDILDYTVDGLRQTLNASWRCDADSVWIGVQKDTAVFSATGKQLYAARYTSWANNDWVPSYKQTLVYDEADRILLNERYNWTENQWRGSFRYEYGYDGQGRQTYSATFNSWSTTTNSWVGTTMTETVFDEAGNTLEKKLYNWSNGWTAFNRYLYTYDTEGHLVEQVVQSFGNNEWQNVLRYEKGYQGNLLVVSNNYTWINNAWRITSQSEKTYDEDAEAKLRREIIGQWNNSTGASISYTDNLYFYDCDFPYYTIRFENYDGSLLQSSEVKETKKPVYKGEKPSRPADAQYTYTFKGWTPAIVAVTGDATYTADYDSIVNRYRITWLDADDTEIAADSLDYGATPSHEDLVKTNTVEWTYSFVGWTPAITSVTADATYKAQFDSVRNSYRITWLDVDDTELAADSLSYGVMPSREYVLKANTAEWTYSFVGWTPEIAAVTGDATYKAQIDSVRNSYRITWLDADDTEIAVDSLVYGATPSREYVLKANTAEWTYSFVGWTPEIVAVTGDATYKAQIDSVRNRYRITWLDADDTEITVDSLAYGAMPSREYVLKANTAEWTYSFVGWTPEIVAVTADATYKAQIDSVRNRYRVTWLDADDAELAVDSLAYGAMPSREYVLKANTAEWTYSFVGWTPEIAAVTGDATYKAQIDSVRNRYRITWLDADDTEIAVDSLAYGATPSREYVLKANTAEWTYSFVGWTPEIAAVSADATYKAQIDSVRNNYLVTFKNGVDTLQSTLVAYGTMPVYGGETPAKQADAQYTYSFNGWDAELVAITGETTYNATFSSTVNNYTITWLLDDGTKIDEQSVAYGTTPSHTDAYKDNTAQYTITFVGWDKAFAAVTGDETYMAVFDSVVNRYTVIFYFEDGVTVLDSKEFEYGEMPSTSLIPSLPATAKYTYTFEGWSPELQPVTGNATYTPVFDSIVNTYTVTFVNYNDMVLQSSQVPYDDVPEYTGETPTKPSSYKYHYVFTGWTPELVAVTGDARYKAVYDQVLNRYTIIFYDEDGLTILDSVEVEYGEMPETSVVPTKEDDEEYTYTFAGWSPKIVTATKNTSYTATYTATRKTEGLWDVEAAEKAQKVMIDGVIYIRRGGKIYTLDGTEVE